MRPLKKHKPWIVSIVIGVIVGVVAASAVFSTTGFSIFGNAPSHTSKSADMTNAELTALAFEVLELISDGDFQELSEIIHPDFGIVFSPTATISLSANRHFFAEQVAQFGTDNTVYVWGLQNGTGIPISLTPTEYFARFVPAKDYMGAPVIGIDHIIRSGNALENIKEEFPGIRFIDFHIPGGEGEAYDDLDWRSLRLGFEKHNERLWLVVISHSTWTV